MAETKAVPLTLFPVRRMGTNGTLKTGYQY